MKTTIKSLAAVAAVTFAAPVFAFTVWPDIDFEWYANVGRYDARPANPGTQPAARPGYIWAPEHWETAGEHQKTVAAHWVLDDYYTQLAIHNHPPVVADAR